MSDESDLAGDGEQDGAREAPNWEDGDAMGGPDPEAILAEAALERMHRQAYWHGSQRQLFTFLFANCLFFAGALVAWTRSGPGDPAGDPSTYITGMHTIRGAFIFALALYGFWTAVFNIWHGQMKIWPYLVNAALALWVGIGGFANGIGGPAWDKANVWLENQESSKLLDKLLVPMGTIPPGCWLLTAGGLLVVWVIVMGLLRGQQASKASAAEGGRESGRRRR